jgi:hypothetical protein
VLELVNLSSDLLSFSKSDWEQTHLDKHVTEQLGGLLSNRVTSQKHVVLLGPLFDLVLVLVKGLETVDVDVGDAVGSCLLDVCSVGEDADLNSEMRYLDVVVGLVGKTH